MVDPFAPSSGGFRMAVCSVDEVPAFKNLLLPGGVLIARSSLPVSYENSIRSGSGSLRRILKGADGRSRSTGDFRDRIIYRLM